MTSVKTPSVLWAQRSSATTKQKNYIHLTAHLQGIIHSTLKYTITETTISLRVNANEGDERYEYAFELDFYAEVVPEALEKRRTPQSVTIVIFKKDITARYWPQLSKTVLPYVKTDFSRWTWEGDEWDEDGSTDIISMDMDSSSAGSKNGEPLKSSNQGTASPSIKTPATPQVLWAQRSSPTESMKNFIYLSVNAPDIAESTLKCSITDTSISFRAYAREEHEEREYAFDLDLYADVIPEAMEKHLTEQCLTIILFKKQLDARYWPRLQKAEGLLPYIRTDFKRWTWEGDERRDNISAKAEIHSLGKNNGRHFMKAGDFNNRGIFFSKRFKRLGEIGDIEKSISNFEDAVQLTPDGHAEKADQLSNLGCSLRMRFEHLGEMGDVKKSISSLEDAVRLTPSSYGNLPIMSSNLGNSYLCRFERTRDLKDIECAISHNQKAVESTPSGHADLPRQFSNLGNSYLGRFGCSGNLEDIDCAISHHQKAVESTPSGHANLPAVFNNLGNSYSGRFKRTGDPKDIDCAISHHQKAVESTPSGHADLLKWFSNLGNSYLSRFSHTGNLEDMDCAISHHQKALESIPPGHANLGVLFGNLGNSYLSRFARTGDLKDIDCAISYHQKAVESTPSGHIILPTWFNNLGSSYFQRFERTGDLKDIDCAISHHQKAVESTPSGHPDLPRQFNNLGKSCSRRFECTGNLEDIDCAISHHQKAVESTPSGHPDLPAWLNSLGNSYACHFEQAGDPKDIDYAISYHKKAVESTPSGHPDFPNWVNNVGTSYLKRFRCTGDQADIDCAISHHQKSVESPPSGHADLPIWFNNLGSSYLHRFGWSHYSPDVQQSIASYRRGAKANGTPSIRLTCAKNAAMLSSIHDSSDQCLIDLSLSISLLSEVAGLEQTIHRRHANLHGHPDFVASAVAIALNFNRLDLALEWLEQGRCLVWNQINQLRTPIDDLRTESPSLADRFKKVASALESHGTRSISSIPSSLATLAEDIRLQDDTRNHTLYAAEYRQLLEEVRSLPGFNDFLRPPKAVNLLSSLPSNGPVIIFNIHNTRCDALALIGTTEGSLHIPLKDFSLTQAEELQKTLQLNILEQREVEDRERTICNFIDNPAPMSFILQELWHKIVQPILAALGYLVLPNPLNRSRIWWCPTGPLAFLPLHAAGIYGSAYFPGSCVSDFVVSSYTPTICSINDKFTTSSTTSRSTNLLLISQPNTPGLKSIPSTRKEMCALEALMKGTAVNALLLEDYKATREKVKTEMKSHKWAHFACHGVQDVHQPLESGLCLYDGRLELIEIMKQEIPNPDLVFLSACQTSQGDLKLSEEVVHLAAGMLAAGYRGVVGTMWSISDRHGPDFATAFYQYLLREGGSEGLDSTRAAYALDYATRTVRETLGEDDNAFLTWVPYVHFGY